MYIRAAIDDGYDVEVDIRLMDDGVWYLGHDEPCYEVDPRFLIEHPQLWLHCKNIEALSVLSDCGRAYHYFWNEEDKYAMTSLQFVWTYPGADLPKKKGIAVMPEKVPEWNLTNAIGVCSDFIEQYK
jgi:hypothetical protein